MTIQRQYSLPNCTLVLEGLGDATSLTQADPRPLMSVLINAECYLAGLKQPLSGGREFLETLIKAVSRYTQDFLSGLHSNPSPETPLIHLERLNAVTHRLNLRSDPTQTSDLATLTQVDLTTVQLFDLVEAIDQFLADRRTLPDLSFDLAPISKRGVDHSDVINQQLGPLTIGVSGLALATLALFAIPVPKVSEPKELFTAAPTTSSSPSPSGTPSASPQPTVSPSAANQSDQTSPAAKNSPDLNELTAKIDGAPTITDAASLADLSSKLRTELQNAWNAQKMPQRDLIYRVGVAQDGTIIGFKANNPDALDNAKETPLLDLVYHKVPSDRPANEPLAQFRVLFTPSGVVEVTPWESTATASPSTGEITDSRQMEELLPKVKTALNQNWSTTPNIREDLTYRIRVKPDGSILDYRAETPAAEDMAKNTPLAAVSKPEADSNAETIAGSYAVFKVVFKSPDGAVEISPWRGWQN